MIKLSIRTVAIIISFVFLNVSTVCASPDSQMFYEWLSAKHKLDPNLNTNQIVGSVQFNDFLENNISNKTPLYLGMTKAGENRNFKYHLREVLGGPPDKIHFANDGTILISGCRHRSCPEKGFVWIDTKEDKQGFAIVSYFFNSKVFHSNGILVIHSDDFVSKEEFPNRFWESVDTWLNAEKIQNYEVQLLN